MEEFKSSRMKKLVAIAMSASVLFGGALSLTSNAALASKTKPVSVAASGNLIKVTKDNRTILSVTKSDKFNAILVYTSPKGVTDNIKITVTPTSNNQYKIVSVDESSGKKFEATGAINPLDDSFNHTISSVPNSSPNVLIKALIDGTVPSWGDIAATFGSTVANQVLSNWPAIVAAFAEGGFWAVVALLADWPVVGTALAVSLAY